MARRWIHDTDSTGEQMKVFVYYNLHKHTWSIRNVSTGLVIGHSDTVLLANVQGKVSQAGRERVLRDKRKNVHAGIVGELVHTGVEGYFPGLQVTYNPYRFTTFVYSDTLDEFKGAQFAYMENKKVHVI